MQQVKSAAELMRVSDQLMSLARTLQEKAFAILTSQNLPEEPPASDLEDPYTPPPSPIEREVPAVYTPDYLLQKAAAGETPETDDARDAHDPIIKKYAARIAEYKSQLAALKRDMDRAPTAQVAAKLQNKMKVVRGHLTRVETHMKELDSRWRPQI